MTEKTGSDTTSSTNSTTKTGWTGSKENQSSPSTINPNKSPNSGDTAVSGHQEEIKKDF